MKNRIGLIAAWLLVTLLGISVTSAAVGSVRSSVTDTVAPRFDIAQATGPVAALPSTLAPTTQSTPTPADTPDPGAFDPGSPDGLAVTSTSSGAISSSTVATSPPAATATPTPTSPPTSNPPSTTFAPPSTTAPALVKSYTAVGGSVTVEVAGNRVTLLGAVPNSGFSAKEKSESDADKVVVEFESENHKSTITVEAENGVIEVDIDEDSDGGDDD